MHTTLYPCKNTKKSRFFTFFITLKSKKKGLNKQIRELRAHTWRLEQQNSNGLQLVADSKGLNNTQHPFPTRDYFDCSVLVGKGGFFVKCQYHASAALKVLGKLLKRTDFSLQSLFIPK